MVSHTGGLTVSPPHPLVSKISKFAWEIAVLQSKQQGSVRVSSKQLGRVHYTIQVAFCRCALHACCRPGPAFVLEWSPSGCNQCGTVCQWLFTCWPWDILRIDFLAPPPNDAKILTQVTVIDNLLVFFLLLSPITGVLLLICSTKI